MVSYFFDTYPVIELIEGNPDYARFREEPTTMTIFNLAEIYWVTLNKLGEHRAEEVYKAYRPAVVEIDDETLKESIKFRKKYKKRDLSYTDCMGYVYAKRHGLRFPTGDKEFADLSNVEFVKRRAA